MNTSRRVYCRAGVAIAATAALASGALAATAITVDNNNAEAQRKSSDGTTYMSQAQPWSGQRIGYQASFGSQSGGFGFGGIDAILFFKLPTAPAGQVISSASLSLSLLKNSESNAVAPAFNVDLYALGFDKNSPPNNDGANSGYASGGVASSTVAPAYFYVGPSQASTTITAVNPNNVASAKIQEDVFTPTDWAAAQAAADHQVPGGTNATGNNALASYVQNLYGNANFTAGHDFLVLRMNPDVNPPNTNTRRYQIPFAQTPTYNDGGLHTPTSTTATVPTLVVDFALLGDVNSDGTINADDYALVDRGRAKFVTGAIAAGATKWTDGDFNHDGAVDAADYLILDTAYGHQIGAFSPDLLAVRQSEFGDAYVADLVAAVPEPSTLLAVAGLTLFPLGRRRGR